VKEALYFGTGRHTSFAFFAYAESEAKTGKYI
jgi:hypothetical protein